MKTDMNMLLIILVSVFILPVFAQEERLGLTQDEFEDVFVDSEEYTKLMQRLYDLEKTDTHP